jgi:hypothetical protein
VSSDRPYRLECWEIDPDLADFDWRLWSTYITEENALERRDKLIGKGHQARVVNSATGVVSSGAPKRMPCPHCDDHHRPPYDGSCLL